MSTSTVAPPARPVRRRLHMGTFAFDVLGIVVALTWAFPVYWMVLGTHPECAAASGSTLIPPNQCHPDQLPARHHRSRLPSRPENEPDDHPSHGGGCLGLRIPRGLGDQQVSIPRPEILRARDPHHSDASRRRAVHCPVQDAPPPLARMFRLWA